MRSIYLLLLFVVLSVSTGFATDSYSYVSYVAYPKSELRGYSIERMSNGQFEFQKRIHPVNMPGATPIGFYLATDPEEPDSGQLFGLGLTETGPRKLFNCGIFFLGRINNINCTPLTNATGDYSATGLSGGINELNFPILSAAFRMGNKDFVQGLRIGGPIIKADAKFSFFAAPHKLNNPGELVSQGISWDVSLIAKTTATQFVVRELGANGKGTGPTFAFNYNPSSRAASINLSVLLGGSYQAYWREQRHLGTANAESSVWKADIRLQPSLSFDFNSFRQVVGWKKTGNTNGELFNSVAFEPNGEYLLNTTWLPSCKKLGLEFRASLPDGTFKAPKKLETCGSLNSSDVGVLGINISPTYETD